VNLIISGGHTGIESATGKMFPGSSWQLCHVHFFQAVLRKIPRKYHKEIAETLKECLSNSNRLLEFAVQFDERGLSRAADTIHRFHHGLMNYRVYPPEYWKKSGLPISWNELIKNLNVGAKRSGPSQMMPPCSDSLVRSLSISMKNGPRVTGIYLE
jgi:transposase-like protein